MGVRRKTLILGFSIALFLGVAVYFRLWSMDSRDASFTADDREVIRRQFERANMEAMDESAEWRMKFDGEYERSKRLQEELSKIKRALEGAENRLAELQKENVDLRKKVETLTQKVDDRQRHCNCSQTAT